MDKTWRRTCGRRGRASSRGSLTSLATNAWGFKDELAVYLMGHGSEGKGVVTNTLTLESVIIGRTWHYHYFVITDDQRYMRCLWPGCDVVLCTCSHHYQDYGPAYRCCPDCQEVRRVEVAGLFGMALVQQPVGGDVDEDKEQ